MFLPDWRGDIFGGSLQSSTTSRALKGDPLREVANQKPSDPKPHAWRRTIVEAPDGAIWFISVGNGGGLPIGTD